MRLWKRLDTFPRKIPLQLQHSWGRSAPASPLFALTQEQVSQEAALQQRLADTGKTPLTPHQGRITPSSHNITSLEKGCADSIRGTKEKYLKMKGPVQMPTKTLGVTTRKTLWDEGSKTLRFFKVGSRWRSVSDSLTCTVFQRLLSRLLPPVLSSWSHQCSCLYQLF